MSTDDSEGEARTKRRSKAVASLLTGLCPGLGYLYIGQVGTGLIANACFVGLLVAFVAVWTLLEFFPIVPGALLLFGWFVFTALAIGDVRSVVEQRDEPYELRGYNHWTIYSAIYLVGFLLPIAAVVLFAQSLFWTVAPVETTAMYPNLVPDDRVLVRKDAYRNESLRPGDLVAVQPNRSEAYRVLRVAATGPTDVRLAANNIEVGERTLPRIPLEATPGATTASASAAIAPDPSSQSPGRGSDTTSGADRTDSTDENDRQFDPDAYELMVERNATSKYVVSLRPSANAKPSFETHELGKDELFLLADNRSAPEQQSGDAEVRDSRTFGPVRRDAVVGKPMYVAWSRAPDTGSIRWDRIGLRLR